MNVYMQIAKRLADANLVSNGGGPFGACIVRDGEVVGKGSNQVIKNNDPTAHAEMVAIRDACHHLNTHDLSGCEIYTSCYPCPMCLSAIIWSNMKVVYYGNTKEDAAKIGFRDEFIYDFIHDLTQEKENEDILHLINIDRDETRKSFEEYGQKKDKIMY